MNNNYYKRSLVAAPNLGCSRLHNSVDERASDIARDDHQTLRKKRRFGELGLQASCKPLDSSASAGPSYAKQHAKQSQIIPPGAGAGPWQGSPNTTSLHSLPIFFQDASKCMPNLPQRALVSDNCRERSSGPGIPAANIPRSRSPQNYRNFSMQHRGCRGNCPMTGWDISQYCESCHG